MTTCTVEISSVDSQFVEKITAQKKAPSPPSGVLEAYYTGWGYNFGTKKFEYYYNNVPREEALVAREALKVTHPDLTYTIN